MDLNKLNELVLANNTIQEERLGFEIIPNPASSFIEIKLEGTQLNIKSIEFFDIIGRKLFYQLVDSKIPRIDISKLKQGVFFVKIKLHNGKTMSKKLIVE